jgi:bacillithiol system protein YtxJ
MNWNYLENISELDTIEKESFEHALFIFKHSTRCGISRMVLKQFEREFGAEEAITPYFLDLLEHRNISNEIASRFGVVHQSPQVIVIKDGKAVYDTSHESIDAGALEQFA